ncbi:MAG: S-layer homology domain-containing protein, partial [Eubacteriales bacterium]
MKSKLLIGVLVVCLMLGMVGLAYAGGLTDIGGNWAKVQIDKMVSDGVIKGYPDGTFRPNKQVSRAEFTAIINQAFGKFKKDAAASFSDVQVTDWCYSQVASGKLAGYISGYPDNTFRSDNPISRAEAAAMLAKLLKLDTTKSDDANHFKDARSIEDWSKGSIAAVSVAKVMGGYPDGSFKPANYITRAEAVVAVGNALLAGKPDPVISSGGGGGGGGGDTPTTPATALNNVLGQKIDFLGAYRYIVTGDVTTNVYRVEVTIGTQTSTVTPVTGKFTAEYNAEVNLNSALVKAKASDGTVLAEKPLTFTTVVPTAVMSNLSGRMVELLGVYMYSVTGDVTAGVSTVEVTIGSDTITVTPVNGKFTATRTMDSVYTSARVRAKAANGSIIGAATVAITSPTIPPRPAISNVTWQKAPAWGSAYLYVIQGEVNPVVAEVEVAIGGETYTVTPDDGKFDFQYAIDGDYTSATLKAKALDGTVTETATVALTDEVITNLVGKKLPLFGAYLYSVEGNVTSDVASVEVTVGSEVFAADLKNGEFTVGCAA